jgi:internalin A
MNKYNNLLEKHNKHCDYISNIQDILDKKYWIKCQNSLDISFMSRDYIVKFPNGIYLNEAKIIIKEYIQEENEYYCINKEDKNSYREFLEKYSNGYFTDIAKNELDELLIKQAKTLEEERVRGIEDEKNRKVNNEKEKWEKAKKENFSNTYLEYCESYPTGLYVDEAKKRYEEEILIEKDIFFLVEWIDENCFSPKPEDVRELKKILTLNINISSGWGEKKKLKKIPQEIGKLVSLEELIISSNNIDKIPSSIGNLKNLKKLIIDCSFGIILSIPETIGDLNNLEELILKLNKYTKIPTSIQKCLKLKKLDINITDIYDYYNLTTEVSGLNFLKNKFLNKQEKILDSSFYRDLTARIYEVSIQKNDILEALKNIPNIEEINLTHEKLKQIPNWIENYVRLKKLSISYANNIEEIPTWIGNLIYLEELYINTYYQSMTQSDKNRKAKRLTKLPNSICELRNLKKLILKSGELSELPEHIGNLMNLEELNIQGSFNSYSFKKLPKSIVKLKNLRILNISWKNNLEELPKDIFTLNNLEEFYAVTCNIKEFPKNITNAGKLKKIALSGNGISFIPSSIEKMKSLEALHLNGNPLESFPQSIMYLNNLKLLVLDNCNLSTIPNFIENCQNLETLSISHNELIELPESIGNLKNLKNLSCGYNNIVELPESIYNLEKIEYIWIMHNKLSSKCKSKLDEWKYQVSDRHVDM